jgi:isoquinoline 1-oxidoreductase beta subunit
MTVEGAWSRRAILQAGVAASGGLLVGCAAREPAESLAAVEVPPPPASPANFGAYLEIDPNGGIFITCPQSEMGQGVHDSLPRILAEELGADWQSVRVRLPYADDAFINPITKRHRTAASDSVVNHYEMLRRIGAGAREMLVAAAAQRWGVAAAECTVLDSRVLHAASQRSASFAELASAAAQLPVPSAPVLKDPAAFTLIGHRLPNKAIPAKCDGSATFGIDIRLPNMLYAALARSPAVTSRVVSFDATAVRAMPGVVDVVQVSDGVAVLARSTWQAFKAAAALEVTYDTADATSADQPVIDARLRAAIEDDANALPARRFGGPPYDRAVHDAAMQSATKRLTFDYEVPFLAHAALEPLCCTVLVTADTCEVWAPTQHPDGARDAVAKITGVARDRVKLHVTLLGGGFGRKWELDFVKQAAEIGKHALGTPVKLTWTREQDFQHDRFRPAYRARTQVGLDQARRIATMKSRIVGIDMWAYQGRAPIKGFGDAFAAGGLIADAYAIPSPYVESVPVTLPIPVGTWRSVSASQNVFFCESAIDEIAAAQRRDPLELRRELLAKSPRMLAVMEHAAAKADWHKPLPKGRGRGLAIIAGFGSYCAEVIEVTVVGKRVSIDRIVCAFDCGTVIDPSMLLAQAEGGVVWGLSAARDGQVRFDGGAARESNFHDSPLLRINECPPIEVHLVPSTAKPGGAGEATVAPVAPALASAIAMATGKRSRRLPLIADGWEF